MPFALESQGNQPTNQSFTTATSLLNSVLSIGYHVIIGSFVGMENTINLKVCLLGDSGVGKTSLIQRFADGTFTYQTHPTMLDYTKVRVQVEGDTVMVNIIDNAGIERCLQMQRSINQRADCLILVYDVNDKKSFDHLDKWLQNIKDTCEENMQILVVGNKVDQHYYDREVSNEDIVDYARGKEAVFMETSAKDDYNVNEIFFRAIKMILKSQGMLLPGCDDPFMRHRDRESIPVSKASLKKVIVPRKSKDKDVISVTNTVPPKPANNPCPC